MDTTDGQRFVCRKCNTAAETVPLNGGVCHVCEPGQVIEVWVTCPSCRQLVRKGDAHHCSPIPDTVASGVLQVMPVAYSFTLPDPEEPQAVISAAARNRSSI